MARSINIPLAYAAANDDARTRVKPLDVPCRYCRAEPGETCTKWRRSRPRGKYRVPRHYFHPDRVYDARCASEAAEALAPNELTAAALYSLPALRK